MDDWNIHDEFWWLPGDNATVPELYCELVHTDVPFSGGDTPPELYFAWTASTTSEDADLVHISEIPKWWNRYKGVNVHRSLTCYLDIQRENSVVGPVLFDIDGKQEMPEVPRLENARRVALNVADWLIEEYQIGEEALRCYFSGWKGFHIEVRPDSIGMIASDFEGFKSRYDNISKSLLLHLLGETGRRHPHTNEVDDTFIDPLHKWIRLANSVNCWQEGSRLKSARRMKINLEQLKSTSIDDLISQASVNINRL